MSSLPRFFLRRHFAALALIALSVTTACAQQVSLALDSISHPAFTALGVNVVFDLFRPGVADITVADAQVGQTRLRNVELHCDGFQLDDAKLVCAAGQLRYGKRAPIAFSASYRFAEASLDLALRNTDVAVLALVDPRLQRWHPRGRFDLDLKTDRRTASIDLRLDKAAFNTDDYSIAGESIVATVKATARRVNSDWQWQTEVDWSGGEAFFSPWYRKADVQITAQGVMTPAQLRVDLARVTLDRLGSLTAGLTWNRKTANVVRWGFVTEPLDLGAAVKEWVQPVLDAHALPTLTATGTTRYAAEWSDGGMQFFYAGIENASFREGSGRLSLNNVNASVPWSRSGATEAELSVGGGELDRLPMGGFRVPVQLNGFDVAIRQVAIPLLDGRIRIEDFHASRPQVAWSGRFSGGIEDISMPRLTSAAGLPTMAGSLSMKIPAARYENHVLDLDGDMSIDVFNGRITLRNLQLIEPLTKTSRFVSDVEARRLDLGLLTSTFSFGSIVGLLDADIRQLELQNWKPLSFRARINDSPGNYRRAISRGALIDISSLGGSAGAAAVRALPAASFINTFRYDHIGVGCELKDGVCRMEGLHPEANGYVLVEGGGIPAVKVLGYNHQVDWNLLVSRIKAVIAGKTKAVIE